MAVPAALIPPSALVHPCPISTSSSSASSAASSSCSAIAASSSSPSATSASPQSATQNLFRTDLIGSSCGGGGIPLAGKPVYSTPSPVENTPQNNECRMVELRGAKVASFTVDGQELICLPQAFDLFLKHLVGGLHTVYTKLKRLEITPVVCNVEQVRILRGLGAIQPGVNRCKLISRKDFETLYNDCTNARAEKESGRPVIVCESSPYCRCYAQINHSFMAASHLLDDIICVDKVEGNVSKQQQVFILMTSSIQKRQDSGTGVSYSHPRPTGGGKGMHYGYSDSEPWHVFSHHLFHITAYLGSIAQTADTRAAILTTSDTS
ncbi:hypothetical protein DNTS_026879 [Danionella cerebrum]|uniref:SKI/SNO/DAC domain-containing protein n=1 Tax=Danionella cerebrum TaxID=2873325 RepID=A0A553QE30_9TELE|nr:hypothetical protein DNTS_026879 [Danionella translucida]